LYGARLAVEFIDRLRDTVRFDNVDKLRAQLAIDMAQARALAKGAPSL
jgi:FAD synthase